jgi:hypothetical protein
MERPELPAKYVHTLPTADDTGPYRTGPARNGHAF